MVQRPVVHTSEGGTPVVGEEDILLGPEGDPQVGDVAGAAGSDAREWEICWVLCVWRPCGHGRPGAQSGL